MTRKFSFVAIPAAMLLTLAIQSHAQRLPTLIPPEQQIQYGQAGDIPVPGRYLTLSPGADLAVWRPSDGVWYFYNFITGHGYTQQWGTTGDIPCPGDYDGDGYSDFCVFRPSENRFWVKNSQTGEIRTVQSFPAFRPGDQVVTGDFDGDGIADFTIWTIVGQTFHSISSKTGYSRARSVFTGFSNLVPVPVSSRGISHQFQVWLPGTGQFFTLDPNFNTVVNGPVLPGDLSDVPLMANLCWGNYSPALWHQYDGTFLNTSGSLAVRWGLPGDIPVLADYYGRGVDEFAVWRPSNGTWYIRYNSRACIG